MLQRLVVTNPKNDKVDPHGVNPTLSIFFQTPFNTSEERDLSVPEVPLDYVALSKNIINNVQELIATISTNIEMQDVNLVGGKGLVKKKNNYFGCD